MVVSRDKDRKGGRSGGGYELLPEIEARNEGWAGGGKGLVVSGKEAAGGAGEGSRINR